jgi:hypothetical protein
MLVANRRKEGATIERPWLQFAVSYIFAPSRGVT